MSQKQTMKEAGYVYVRHAPELGGHILLDPHSGPNGKTELWVANKNHASYGIIYKNTHLEFARSV